MQQETVKNSELTSQVNKNSSLIEQLNQKLVTEKQNYELLDLKGNEQSSLIDSLRDQIEEQTSLIGKQGASGTYKTWTIILLGILLTIASALSANSYLF